MFSNLNLQKIVTAVLLAGLIGTVTGKVTTFLYGASPQAIEFNGEKRGYTLDASAAAAAPAAAAKEAADISALFATADVKAGGEFVAKKCTVCHNIEKGGSNKVGPHLWGVAGRKVASIGDFNYSSGMKSHADRSWTADELNHFLWGPSKWVPGTLMGFAGIPKDQERANVIAYLLTTMTDTPAKLPTAPAKK